jgi:hypothetical protein
MAPRDVSWHGLRHKILIKSLVCASLLGMSDFTVVKLDEYPTNYKDPELYVFRLFLVAVLSLIFLLPHAVDGGTMMDQFLQVPFDSKMSNVLERQENSADRIQIGALLIHFYGFGESVVNLFCCCLCFTRPWDNLDTQGSDEETSAVDEELGENNNHVPHSLEVFCSSTVDSLRRFTRAKTVDGIT